MIDTAMLLAAGFGTRMRPLSNHCPKPLLKLADKSLIDWTLDRLRNDGIKRFIINSHYLPEQISDHFLNQNDVTVIYEEKILETGGGVKNALPLLGGKPFFVVNTDTIITNDINHSNNYGKNQPIIKQMQEIWYDGINQGKIDFLLLLHDRKTAFGYDGKGDFNRDNNGFVTRRGKNISADYVFTGTQIIDPNIFKNSPDNAFSLNILYDNSIVKGRLKSIVNNGGWYHIGTVENLNSAAVIFSNN